MFSLLSHTFVRNSWLQIQGSFKTTFHPCASHLLVSFYTCSLPPYVLLSVQITDPHKWHFPGSLEKWLPAGFGHWEALEEGVEGERRGEAKVFFSLFFYLGVGVHHRLHVLMVHPLCRTILPSLVQSLVRQLLGSGNILFSLCAASPGVVATFSYCRSLSGFTVLCFNLSKLL